MDSAKMNAIHRQRAFNGPDGECATIPGISEIDERGISMERRCPVGQVRYCHSPRLRYAWHNDATEAYHLGVNKAFLGDGLKVNCLFGVDTSIAISMG